MAFGMVEDPVTVFERAQLADTCISDLNLPMPAILDKMDDVVSLAYQAWPDRLYLVDKAGKVAYAGGRGPFFFSPDSLDQSIQELLSVER